MIKYIINSIKCKIKGHSYVSAGSCPYTGKTYNGCTKCGNTIVVDKTE
jgi:hypothetical protein